MNTLLKERHRGIKKMHFFSLFTSCFQCERRIEESWQLIQNYIRLLIETDQKLRKTLFL